MIFEVPKSFTLPEFDSDVGRCGVVKSTGGCPLKAVTRMVVELQYSDEDRYYTGPYFTPYMGDQVMVDLCEEHRDEVKVEFENAVRTRADREKAKAEAAERVQALEEQLREARADLNRY